MSYEFKSRFAERIIGVIEHRASTGRSVLKYREDLGNFDRFCLNSFPHESTLTRELAFAWCNDARNNSNCRVPTIRGFARYLNSNGEAAYMVSSSFFHAQKAEMPYIFTELELKRFFEATDLYPGSRNSPLLEYTLPVIFRLQYACGLRPREVRNIQRAAINFKDGTLYVFDSKHSKDRRLPISVELTALCKKYDGIADAVCPGRTYFFQSPAGESFKKGWLTSNFHRCWRMSGNGNARGACTPYDLRHNFATQTLMRWVEDGKDIDSLIPYLSAYMGHSTFSATYYYIHLLPERLSKMDFTLASGIIPEVDYDEET